MEAVTERLTALLIPSVADGYAVVVRNRDGATDVPAYGHRDASGRELLEKVVAQNPLDLLADGLDAPSRGWNFMMLARLGARSGLLVPLTLGHGKVGALLLACDRAHAYGPERPRARALAGPVSVMIDHALQYRAAVEEGDPTDGADEVIAVAAHELRKPLTAILCNAQLVLRQVHAGGAPTPDQVRDVLERVELQSHRLSALLACILTAGQLNREELQLEAREIDVRQLVVDVVQMVRETNPERKLALTAPYAVFARVDPLRLQQVLSNLLDNALKFSPPHTEVLVRLSLTEAGAVRLVVRDHGPGVPEEQRERIFERYFQTPTAGRSGGVGLGLYISRQIIELHGGQIHAEAPADGGARFVVMLPARLSRPAREGPLRSEPLTVG